MIMRAFSPRLAALAAAFCVVTGIAGCGSAAGGASSPSRHPGLGSFPAAVTAANGTVHIRARPKAIVSLSPTATEMLYAIGAGPQVKAVDKSSDYPPGVPTTRLDGVTPSVEAIIAYKPDLVIGQADSGGLTRRLGALSVPVLVLPAPADLSGVYAQFTELGRATGHVAQASREAARLRAQIRGIAAAAPHQARPVTYYYEIENGPYYSETSSTFIGRLLGLLGMKSIADGAKGAAASGGYPQLSAEYIIRANPDYILLADTLCCHQDAAKVASRPGWSRLKAVTQHHVVALNDSIASRWGPRLVILLRTVLAAIRGNGGA
jgi:iron complex transport system substrate-binding protein